MARSQVALLQRMTRLAKVAIPGTLVEVLLRCGTKSCGCHRDPARRHGPHLYLKFRDADGRSRGIYLPRTHAAEARRGVRAWSQLWETSVALGEFNRQALHQRLRRRKK